MASDLTTLGTFGAVGAEMEQFCRYAREQMASAKKKVDARQGEMRLNLAYFVGKQWVEYDEIRGKVVPIPETEDELRSIPKRVTNNILRRQLTDAVGQIVGVPPRMEAIAASAQDSDIIKAKVTDRILEALWAHLEMRSFWYDAHLYKGIYGTSFQMAYWDAEAGPSINGRPSGDIACIILPPTRVYADPTAERVVPEPTRPTDAKWVYVVMDWPITKLLQADKWMTMRSEVNEETGCPIFYGGMPEEQEIVLMSKSSISDEESELMVHTGRNPEEESRFAAAHRYDNRDPKKKNGKVRVVYYIEQPSTERPNGRFAAFLPDNDFWPLECRNEMMYATAQNPKGIFPVTQLVDVIVPGMLLGRARMSEAREIQDIINQLMSRYSEELKKLTPYFQYDEACGIAEEAVMDSLAARVLRWDSRSGGQPPQVVIPHGASMTSNLIENALLFCIRQSEDKMGIHNVRYYPNAEATLGELRMQKNEDLTSLEGNDVIRAEESAYGPFMKACAQLVRWGYLEERIIEFVGDRNAVEVIKFKGEDLSFKDVRIVPSSSMPASKHLQKMELMDLIVKGFFQDPDPKINRELRRSALRIMNMEMPLEASIEELACNRARAENQEVLQGKNIRVHRGEPAIMHISEHMRFLNTPEFYNLEPNKQQAVEALILFHCDQHAEEEWQSRQATGMPAAMAASASGSQLTEQDFAQQGGTPGNPMEVLPPGTGAPPGTRVELPGANKTGSQGGSLGM